MSSITYRGVFVPENPYCTVRARCGIPPEYPAPRASYNLSSAESLRLIRFAWNPRYPELVPLVGRGSIAGCRSGFAVSSPSRTSNEKAPSPETFTSGFRTRSANYLERTTRARRIRKPRCDNPRTEVRTSRRALPWADRRALSGGRAPLSPADRSEARLSLFPSTPRRHARHRNGCRGRAPRVSRRT